MRPPTRSVPTSQVDERGPLQNSAPFDADRGRRQFLIVATAATGVVGATFVATPFIQSLQPSAKAQAVGGPVTVNLQSLEPGAQITVIWRGRPIWISHRTPEMLERLSHENWISALRDPESSIPTQQPSYATNQYRSLQPQYFVAVALCTHLGCVPLFKPEVGLAALGDDWMGGYFCPCHGSLFDLAGRVTKNVPAPTNFMVPPHRFLKPDILEIGVDSV